MNKTKIYYRINMIYQKIYFKKINYNNINKKNKVYVKKNL